jgi:chromate reductase
MPTSHRVAVIVGSLRKDSLNRKMAKALGAIAPASLSLEIVEIGELPLYNQDDDAAPPAPSVAFKEKIAGADAVLFVTPEYNRSIPGGLKNAIDWASRPYGTNAFSRKPSAVIGTSPGKIGTAIGQQHLRSILGFCNSPQMNAMEAYIQFEKGLITEDGTITNESTEKFLRKYMEEFHAFIERVYTVLPRN